MRLLTTLDGSSLDVIVEVQSPADTLHESTPAQEIYAIGHSTATLAEVLDLLRKYNIETVVDVRSIPYSAYVPQFNRGAFARALEAMGINYVFAGQSLGGRPARSSLYRHGQKPRRKTRYLQTVDYQAVNRQAWYQEGILRLIALAGNSRTAVLCTEENPQGCHRHHLIAQTLLDLGFMVWHIRHTGEKETALRNPESVQQLSLFREEAGG